MALPGEGLSSKDIQNLSDEIISELFGNLDKPYAHANQETTNMPLPEEATSAGSLKFFTEMPSALSRANYAGLQKSFPGSPINNSPDAPIKLTPEDVRVKFVNLVLRGPVCDFVDVSIPGGDVKTIYSPVPGYNFTSFNRDYWANGAPGYDVINQRLRVNWKNEEYRAGDPGNAFMPNIVSVPRGEIEGYGDLPQNGRPPEKIKNMDVPQYGGGAFIGVGTALSPGKSSKQISKRVELVLGKSSLESVGALSDGQGN